MGLGAPRALCGVLFLCLAHVATAQTSCTAGKQDCDGAGTSSTCCECPIGTFKTTTSTAACTTCATGKYLTTTGATTATSCVDCGAGKYQDAVVVTTNPPLSQRLHSSISTAATGFGQSQLDSPKCWAAAQSTTPGEWMMIDLYSTFRVHGLVTQCRADTSGSQCVTGVTVTYDDQPVDARKTFSLRTTYSSSSKIVTYFDMPVMARYIRIFPVAWTGWVSMRAGVLTSLSDAAWNTCADCGAGKYSTATGASLASTCTDCGAGKYSTATGASVATTCTDCGAGKYSTATGASVAATCTDCDAGKYSLLPGSSTCQDCPLGKTSAVGSSLFSQCVCKAGTALELNFNFPVGIQQTYPTQSVNRMCAVCYDEPYSHATGAHNIENCKTAAGTGWILMGTKTTSASTSFSVAVFIQGSNFIQSSSTSVAYFSNGAYWYFYNGYSVGFAPASNIRLFNADWQSPEYTDCAQRVSWHLDLRGGWRSGCTFNLESNTVWRKMIYLCQTNFCNACPSGKYSTLNATVCTECGVGKYAAASEATDASTCLDCAAGKYSTATGASLADTCTDCGAGKYSTATGSSTCLDCGAGKYSETVGASQPTTCINCAAIEFSAPGSDSAADCQCNAGTRVHV